VNFSEIYATNYVAQLLFECCYIADWKRRYVDTLWWRYRNSSRISTYN